MGGPLDLLGTAIRPTIEFRVDGHRLKLFEIAGMTSGESAFDGQPGPQRLDNLGGVQIAMQNRLQQTVERGTRQPKAG